MEIREQASPIEDWIVGHVRGARVLCLVDSPERLVSRLTELGYATETRPDRGENTRYDTIVFDVSTQGDGRERMSFAHLFNRLAHGGKLVLAAPFGGAGGGPSLYPAGLVAFLGAGCRVDRVEILENNILAVATRRDADDDTIGQEVDWVSLLEQVEGICRARLSVGQQSCEKHSERASELRREARELARKTDELRGVVRALDQEKQELGGERASLSGELATLRARRDAMQEAIGKAHQMEEAARANRDLEEKILAEDEKHHAALEETRTLQTRLASLSVEVATGSARRDELISILARADVQEDAGLLEGVQLLLGRLSKLEAFHRRVTADDRYLAGDALVRAMRPSVETLKLPLRLGRILLKRTVKSGAAEDNSSRVSHGTEQPANLSSPGRPVARRQVRMCAVLDDFSEHCFAPECRLTQPRPDNWKETVDSCKPDLVLVESAWRGNHGAWQYRVARYNAPPGHELIDLTAWACEQGVPSVFWNKEDPVHHERFIDAARMFDVVLTSDANCVERYRDALGHERIHPLPFAAQPGLHNPMEAPAERIGRACFAGSYYRNRHPERRQELEMLLDAARDEGLDIYDRNHGEAGPGAADFRFPERFRKYIRGRLAYRNMVETYRQYRLFLNVNSVVDSPTMFSRRVFELLACGTPVVSTPSRGLDEMLGEAVWIVRGPEEAREAVRTLQNDDAVWRRQRLRGIRTVMSQHTYHHRFSDLLRWAGIDAGQPAKPSVLLLARVARELERDRILEDFSHQSWRKAELLVLAPEPLAHREMERITWTHSAGEFRRHVEDWMQETDREGLLGVMRPECIYGRCYLEDLVHAATYSRAGTVGKDPHGRDSFAWKNDLHPAGCLVSRDVLQDAGVEAESFLSFDPLEWVDEQQQRFVADGSGFVPDFPGWEDPDAVARTRSGCEV